MFAGASARSVHSGSGWASMKQLEFDIFEHNYKNELAQSAQLRAGFKVARKSDNMNALDTLRIQYLLIPGKVQHYTDDQATMFRRFLVDPGYAAQIQEYMLNAYLKNGHFPTAAEAMAEVVF